MALPPKEVAMMGVKVGDVVKVFGHVVVVERLHRKGKMAYVAGATYAGYRRVRDLVKVDDGVRVLDGTYVVGLA